MASKLVELRIAMDNLPIGAGENELVAEIQAMLQREYADGVKVSVSLMQKCGVGAGSWRSPRRPIKPRTRMFTLSSRRPFEVF